MTTRKQSNDGWIEVKPFTEYAPFVNWDETESIEGIVVSVRYVEKLGKRVMEVDTGDEVVSVAETAVLKFDPIKEFMRVRIENRGWVKLRNGRRARDLRLFYKEQ